MYCCASAGLTAPELGLRGCEAMAVVSDGYDGAATWLIKQSGKVTSDIRGSANLSQNDAKIGPAQKK